MDSFRRLMSYARPLGRYWVPYLGLSVLSLVFGVLNYGLLGPLLSVLFEDPAAAAQAAKPEEAFSLDYAMSWFQWLLQDLSGAGGVLAALALVCGAIVVASLLSNLCRYLSARIVVDVETITMKGLRKDLFSKIASLPVGWFTLRRKGDVLSSVTNDVSEVQNAVAGAFHVFLREPLLALGFMAMLVWMSPKLTLVSLVALPVSAFLVTMLTRRLRAGSVVTQRLLGLLTSHFEEAISGSRIIKAFSAAPFVERVFERDNSRHRSQLRKVRNRQELASPVSEFLGIAVAAGVLFYGGWLNYRGELGMSWPEFIVYIMFYWKVLEPAKAMAKSYAALQKGLVSAGRIFSILGEESGIPDGTQAVPGFREAVTFDHVSFAYEGEPVLRDVSLTIPKGHTVALVGPSGAGKSTLADLLPRFWDVLEGAVRIDGTDIRSLRLDELVKLMGIVTQDTILFNDTVAGNIAFGRDDVSREEVERAARIAGAAEFIEKLPDGYDTPIGDAGARLSGGQRQRIAIARAVLKDPPILILDEATSALDAENERIVQQALSSLMEGRTSLVIAHRLSTVRHADCICVVKEGRIVESGKHEDLVAKAGLYSQLCSLQDFS